MIINNNELIWFEKYRPQIVADLVLPDYYETKFKHYILKPTNILLCSQTPGTGKTSTMNAIIREGGFESLFINASLENGIDVLRGKIKQFASTISFNDLPKIVVLDECDNLSRDGQLAIRGMIEEFSSNCRFILTCNYIQKIEPAVVNRFEVYDFDKIYNENKEELCKKIFLRLCYILENESISYNKEDLVKIIKDKYPSLRGMVGDIQKCSLNGKLELKNISDDSDFLKIYELMKSKDYLKVVEFTYSITNPSVFYTWFFKYSLQQKNKNLPQIITIIVKYMNLDPQTRDKQLNIVGCVTELMTLV